MKHATRCSKAQYVLREHAARIEAAHAVSDHVYFSGWEFLIYSCGQLLSTQLNTT
jgi:hypothetical protein